MSRAEPKGSAKDGRRRRAQDQGAGRWGGGPLCYDDSTRVNLGLFQHDVKVIWDQAPHDLSIMDYLIGLEPDLVVATGGAHSDDTEDMACITLYLPQNIIARINVNWLSPVKVSTTLVGGRRKMQAWNDLDPAEKIKVYDKGVEAGIKQGLYQLLVSCDTRPQGLS